MIAYKGLLRGSLSVYFMSAYVLANPGAVSVDFRSGSASTLCASVIAVSPDSIRKAILAGGILATDLDKTSLRNAEIFLRGWLDTFPNEIPLDLLDYLTRFTPVNEWSDLREVHAKAKKYVVEQEFRYPDKIIPRFARALAKYRTSHPSVETTVELYEAQADLRHLLFTNPELIPRKTLVYLSDVIPLSLVPWPDLEMVHRRAKELLAERTSVRQRN